MGHTTINDNTIHELYLEGTTLCIENRVIVNGGMSHTNVFREC
jgi:hypothetical protein